MLILAIYNRLIFETIIVPIPTAKIVCVVGKAHNNVHMCIRKCIMVHDPIAGTSNSKDHLGRYNGYGIVSYCEQLQIMHV